MHGQQKEIRNLRVRLCWRRSVTSQEMDGIIASLEKSGYQANNESCKWDAVHEEGSGEAFS